MSASSIFLTSPPGEPHFFKTLKRDHDEFRLLYQNYKASPSLKEREKIIHELIRGISIHDVIEERFLYPCIEKSLPQEGQKIADHGRTEHLTAKKLLYQIDNMPIDDPKLDEILTALMKDLDHHMKEEEKDVFPQLEAVLTPHESQSLGRDLDQGRAMAPTHPHPSAPDQPPGLTLAGLASAPIDKARDLSREFAGASKEHKDLLSK
eukprot:TRINITY_DN8292_c0_g1_i1.p1 TRINITY_DN8292_c0_g1~~TRINITY_DN8292_c0_g1_i1.p1  ORF type:complete len:207 (+),score=64.52 TRINITY_DN8292_c0_g1_i1:91-711(+)